MHFDFPPKVRDLQQRLTAFMDEHVYPNEKLFYEQVARDLGVLGGRAERALHGRDGLVRVGMVAGGEREEEGGRGAHRGSGVPPLAQGPCHVTTTGTFLARVSWAE